MANISETYRGEGNAESALLSCLTQIPFVLGIERLDTEEKSGPQVDMAFRVHTGGGERIIVAEARRSGQPRYAREATGLLMHYLQRVPDAYGVFIAPYIARQAAAICEAAGIGYIDFAGNCRIAFDQVYIEREGRPNRHSEKRDLRSLYAPKASRVLRVLLTEPFRAWKMQELAGEADVSLGHAANVKQALLDREWADEGEVGFYLKEPEAVLEEWAKNYRTVRNKTHVFYTLDPVLAIERRIGSACRQVKAVATNGRGEEPLYALTSFSAAERIAPHVRYQRASAYVRPGVDVSRLADALGLKAVASGANVELLQPYDEGVFYGARQVEGLWVVNAVQLYLDLSVQSARGEEAASFLLNEVIRPQWQKAQD